MIVFHTDLDNTLIYSYKHDIGEQKRCVELYQGREISFVTLETHRLLQMLSKQKEQLLIVPTTTRTVEQYQRIDLGVGGFRYALACNGGVLLVNESDRYASGQTEVRASAYWKEDSLHKGTLERVQEGENWRKGTLERVQEGENWRNGTLKGIQEGENWRKGTLEGIQKDESRYMDSREIIWEDESWYRDSLEMIQDSVGELHRALEILDRDPRRNFELRFIRDLFVFTKCREPEAVVADLKKVLNVGLVDVLNNGVKVYVIPKTLNKGKAVERFREYVGADYVIAAGDSEFDISMLETADRGIAAPKLAQSYSFSDKVICPSAEKLYAEAVLEQVFHLPIFKQFNS